MNINFSNYTRRYWRRVITCFRSSPRNWQRQEGRRWDAQKDKQTDRGGDEEEKDIEWERTCRKEDIKADSEMDNKRVRCMGRMSVGTVGLRKWGNDSPANRNRFQLHKERKWNTESIRNHMNRQMQAERKIRRGRHIPSRQKHRDRNRERHREASRGWV